jgi:hypothetical protein
MEFAARRTVPLREGGNTVKQNSRSTRKPCSRLWSRLATAALMLTLGAAGAYAQGNSANVTLSGTAANSTISLQPGTPASEYQLAGRVALGSFTMRVVSASAPTTQPSSDCSGANKLYLQAVAGAAVLRFEDGSLLNGNLTGGSDCIDFSAGSALCIRIFKIVGGSGRFNNASGGPVTLTMTVTPVLANASKNPVFFTVTGNLSINPGAIIDQTPSRSDQ